MAPAPTEHVCATRYGKVLIVAYIKEKAVWGHLWRTFLWLIVNVWILHWEETIVVFNFVQATARAMERVRMEFVRVTVGIME